LDRDFQFFPASGAGFCDCVVVDQIAGEGARGAVSNRTSIYGWGASVLCATNCRTA
jgi:hypothetical protein